MVLDLPKELRGERRLAKYFEDVGLSVEGCIIVREVGILRRVLDQRTKWLLELERKWADYVGNPSVVEEYDPERHGIGAPVDTESGGGGGSGSGGVGAESEGDE